jgi:propionate CoA-transferase
MKRIAQNKIVTAADAARLVRDGDAITTSGFVGDGVPEALLEALSRRFAETGVPRGLTLLFAAGQGDGAERGLNRLGHEGLLKRVVGGHWGLIPKIGRLALAGEIEAYNLPQGVISHLYRDIAAGKPGTITAIGLDTFVDPRLGGGRINSATTEDLVERVTLGGREMLFYKGFPIHVALLRGTTADEAGNVTMEREALILDNLAQAMAAKNSGGIVIVQVERIAAPGSLPIRSVVIPGVLVDAVVVAPPELHPQTYGTSYSPYFSGEIRAPEGASPPLPLDARKIIARRAAFELPVNGVVNLGIGMPEGVAAVADEEGLLRHVTLTAEPGVIGGQTASGLDFGAAFNADAVIAQNQQFDFYDGGGIDLACLGMAEADTRGDVNVSRFGPKLAGAGGFINISQSARALVFAGTFTAGGLMTEVREGRLAIVAEGRAGKFRETVEQITFSGARARLNGQRVLYVTERCVFRLGDEGLELTEVAPGIDVARDIIALMGFQPIIRDVAPMDPRIFSEATMGLKVDLLHLDLDARIALAPDGATLFINFGKMRIRDAGDVEMIRARVTQVCAPLGRRVDAIVNYDGATIDPEAVDAYAAMVAALEAQFYGRVSRYSGSAFMRMKLGSALSRCAAPHIFESGEEARAYLAAPREA